MYKMLAFDLDGTLNNDDKVITPMTREAIMAVQEQGVIVALVSGRQAPGLQREGVAILEEGAQFARRQPRRLATAARELQQAAGLPGPWPRERGRTTPHEGLDRSGSLHR